VATFADFDLDGWPDLYVGNDISANSLFRNLGNGHFADLSDATGTRDYRGTMGIAVGDFDHDGDTDFFLTHWVAQPNALYQNLHNDLGDSSNNLFFADAADMVGVGSLSMNDVSWGTVFVDYDNDGYLDLFVVNGNTLEDPNNRKLLQAQPPRLLWNDQGLSYYDLAGASGDWLHKAWNGRGLAAADYDNDGDVDFLVTNNRGPVALLRNHGGNAGHWPKLRLRGVKSNRQGIGAKVWVRTGDVQHYAEMGAGGSYLSQSFSELHFGLGTQTTAERLEVLWPSGIRQVFSHLDADRALEVTESGPQAGLKVLSANR